MVRDVTNNLQPEKEERKAVVSVLGQRTPRHLAPFAGEHSSQFTCIQPQQRGGVSKRLGAGPWRHCGAILIGWHKGYIRQVQQRSNALKERVDLQWQVC